MEKKIRKVVLSSILHEDLSDIYDYGMESFGENMAGLFISNIYQQIYELPLLFLVYPECRLWRLKLRYTEISSLGNTSLFSG